MGFYLDLIPKSLCSFCRILDNGHGPGHLFTYRDIISSDNLHHSSLRPLVMIRSGAALIIPICHESGSMDFSSMYFS
jgi:hypothetical protein